MAAKKRTPSKKPPIEKVVLGEQQKPVKLRRQPLRATHKPRSAWFQARAAWPIREAPLQILLRERARVRAEMRSAPMAADWRSVGPTNTGGRLTSIVCHPDDPDRIWVGAAGGGVWTSTDAGRSWRALWHSQPSLNVGSLAIDPQNPDILYCGTGEANLSADSYAGVGLFRSVDGGENWLHLAPAQAARIPTRIGVIAVDPSDSNHIRLGGIGFRTPGRPLSGTLDIPGGMYVSRDGGTTWARERFVSNGNDWCHSIVFDPQDPDRIYAAFSALSSRSGIWRSSDGGRNWEQLSQGLPHPSLFWRTSLAIAPSQPNTVYALAADSQSRVLGLFRSDDGGDSWRHLHGTTSFHYNRTIGTFSSFYEVQMNYNNTIVIHPENPDHVLCGGVDLHLTEDGGQTWHLVTQWELERGESLSAHADHHALIMPASDPGRVYTANDGGLDVSENGGRRWKNRSNGLAVTMFYDLDVAPSDSRFFGGGSQDNGTPVTFTGRADDFVDITSGDGGWLVFDPADASHIIASIYNMNIFRFRPASGWTDISPPATDAEKEGVWMVYIAMDPRDSNRLFTGSFRVWRTVDDGENWEAVSGSLDGGVITAIEITPDDSQRIYAGTEFGGFFRSTDGGASWSGNLAGPMPGHLLTRIESRPDNADVVVVTVANFGHSHVFVSEDAGETWRDIDRGQLPDVPHHAAVIPDDHPDVLFVASDAGVFMTEDMGATWRDLTGTLPNVMVVDLVYHRADHTLTAATYGRSLWRLELP